MNFKILSNIVSILCSGIVVLVMGSIGYTLFSWQTGLFLILLFIMVLNGGIRTGQDILNEIEKESNKQDDSLRRELK